jgi:hypothetical protein
VVAGCVALRPTPGARISSPGAAVQVRNNSIVTNDGSVSTSLINGYGIWAGDPSNSTSTTAGFGDTLPNNGCIATTGPNAISLFARSFNKTTGDTLINRRSAQAGPHWWQVAAPLRLGEHWS